MSYAAIGLNDHVRLQSISAVRGPPSPNASLIRPTTLAIGDGTQYPLRAIDSPTHQFRHPFGTQRESVQKSTGQFGVGMKP